MLNQILPILFMKNWKFYFENIPEGGKPVFITNLLNIISFVPKFNSFTVMRFKIQSAQIFLKSSTF